MTAFEEGVRARSNGRPIESNPYTYEAIVLNLGKRYISWANGWHEAYKSDDCENGRGGYE